VEAGVIQKVAFDSNIEDRDETRNQTMVLAVRSYNFGVK